MQIARIESGIGFTLIELLVVIVIIGILAYLGLSRYQKAVESSKADPSSTAAGTFVAPEAWTFYSGNPAGGPLPPCNDVPPSNWVACAHRRVCGADAPPCADPSQPPSNKPTPPDINGNVSAGGGAPPAPK